MVVAFTSLEDFIRNRTVELFKIISRTVLPFSQLPKELKEAATIGAARSAVYQAGLANRAGKDPIALVQSAARSVGSTLSGALEICEYSLAYSGPNVTSADLSSALGAFQISDPWNEMSSIASRCGLGSLPLKQAYETMQLNRNRAAHDVNANIQPGDFYSFVQEAKSIAIGFDLLTSRAARLLTEGDKSVLNGKKKLSSSIAIRYIQPRGTKYVEHIENRTRAVKVAKDREEAWRLAVGNARRKRDAVVELNSRGVPIEWYTSEAP
ncbi:hypothetical protein GCM10009754_19820 [Amycolatopsis minnesotensis]|uniref:RiboL-PSP-HEPN domain-containing protein n=2 Tax=Amycolatopsis minnesotensis TaxID=337894 RepID=A0ABN2QF19_9PSEU